MVTEADENYRKAALALANAIREGCTPSFLFCSALRGEGTTTAILNVARHLKSNCGLKPLIVELDLVKPAIARTLKLGADKTLQAISSGELTVSECIQQSSQGNGNLF